MWGAKSALGLVGMPIQGECAHGGAAEWSAMDLLTLISGLDVERRADDGALARVRVCDITEDSSTAVPGSLFVARKGTRDRGSAHVDEAIDGGAVAVLTDDRELLDRSDSVVLVCEDAALIGNVVAERFYRAPSGTLKIAAVTGTNGKTTVAHFVDRIMDGAKQRCGLIGTVEIDDGRERGRAAMTTPPGIELSRTLATMVEHGCKACAMEASSHALDQRRTGAVEIDAAGFTNLTGDHLDYHKELGEYARAKARLFEGLGDGAVAAINVDDAHGGMMIDACADGVRVARCSMVDEGADWFARVEDESIDGMRVVVTSPIGVVEARVGFFGEYNAHNAMIALALSEALLEKLGVGVEDRLGALTRGLHRLNLPRGRMERAGTGKPRVFVDFAHTDDALAHALGAARRVLPEGSKLWCVFGCGGDRDRTKRPRMGRVVRGGADVVVVTSDNPRSEKPGAIVDEVLSGMSKSERDGVVVQVDRARAIRYAVEHADEEDVILICGKGHETEQIVMGDRGELVTHHFDDLEHARGAIEDRGTKKGVVV